MHKPSLLSIGSDARTVKGETRGYRTAIMYLAPGKLSGRNLCPHASAGCLAACLFTAGRAGVFQTINQARIARTKRFLENRAEFMADLAREIESFVHSCERDGFVPCIQLNGTSDISWESIRMINGKNIFQHFNGVQFYDYTKNPVRANRSLGKGWPANYCLVLSRSETNEKDCFRFLKAGGSVSVVFSGPLPRTWMDHVVIDGDKSDLRFLDFENSVVGLSAKGRAKNDQSGFVVATV